MNILAIDYGPRRSGLAVMRDRIQPLPLEPIRAKTAREMDEKILDKINSLKPDLVIFGDCSGGRLKKRVDDLVLKLNQAGTKAKLKREDYSSAAAADAMSGHRSPAFKKKGYLDSLAALEILRRESTRP